MSAGQVHRYHDGTKHHFDRFAPSLGYLDWASQPDPFRAFAGASVFSLVPRDQRPQAAEGASSAAVARLLRYSLGLSAWKSFRASTWPLRVNPSSGNLHPTEAYVIAGSGIGVPGGPGVYHYAADRHALERRCAFARAPRGLLVALTSIHWREAWKYGERAVRYCQHDIGHAIAAIRYAAALEGWRASIVTSVSQADIARLTGLDRDEDFLDAEREEPACLLAIEAPDDVEAFVEASRAGQWTGRANQLSADHVQWSFIDEIAAATRDPGRNRPDHPARPAMPALVALPPHALLLQRRSALAFDGRTPTDEATFTRMLEAAMPGAGVPYDALWWAPRVHLVLFVHRVTGVEPGLYLLPRDEAAIERLTMAFGREFLWERVEGDLPLFRLARGDCRGLAQRLSCDQEIAADGFFSLGMLADFDRSLDEFGPSFYRHLFWESGVVGQALYLAAEAAGARATGIGCFFDDPVHDLLGITDHSFQSLYHFTIGMPVEDTRLTTRPGYPWEEDVAPPPVSR